MADSKSCAGKDCPNPVDTLKCPICQKAGKDVFFCSQECFKKNYVCHDCSPLTSHS